MQLALNNRRQVLNLVCLLLLFIPKRHQSSLSSSFLLSVSSRFIYFVITQKHHSQHTTELPAFQPATLSLLSNIEVAYAYQVSIFHVLEARGTQLPLSQPFCSRRFKTSCVHVTKIGNLHNLIYLIICNVCIRFGMA